MARHSEKPYQVLAEHYERCLEQYGDSCQGVDWPNQKDAWTRYQVMLDLLPENPRGQNVLDVGCGAGHMLEYLRHSGLEGVNYIGLDISEKFVAMCRKKFPEVPFFQADLLTDQPDLPAIDYVLMCGVFTVKQQMDFQSMWDFTREMILQAFSLARGGIAFNVMSKQVDWEREDLFHLPMDDLAWFLTANVSRHFNIRNDYGLYEYTTYVYRQPTTG